MRRIERGSSLLACPGAAAATAKRRILVAGLVNRGRTAA
jgi:hypothetical protein